MVLCALCGQSLTNDGTGRRSEAYNRPVEKKIFWMLFVVLGLVADFVLPFWWGVIATIPIAVVSWWIAYRSEWF